MQLLYPIGLLALAGLIIPVIIHLWSVKQGKTLKIGSIALLGESATASSKSIKITDLLLFILRCLILILIAFVLAQPFIKKTSAGAKNSGWILMDKSQFYDIYKANRKTVDSLLNLGFELHNFDLGFDQFLLKDSLLKTKKFTELSYSSLFNQLNKQVPSGYSVYLFADHRLKNFDGNLPKPNFKLTWKETENTDTLKTWSTSFLGKIYEGKSTPKQTSYSANRTQNLPIISVLIYDPTGTDSRYIMAGLSAISDFTKRKIEFKNWNTPAIKKADVGFWLSDQPINASNLSKLKDSASFLNYEKGKVVTENSNLLLDENRNQTVELKKRIAPNHLKGNTIWTDGFGQPILINEGNLKRNQFHFYSRFNPQWTDLVWNEQFVKALIPIVLGNQDAKDFGFEDHSLDQRIVDKTQFSESKIIKSNGYNKTENKNIDYIIWSLAFVLLIIERILSFRKKTNLDYVKN
ncbi:BatA domain-containing protein [Pedobacter fastidiosus]|uniref:BatA domain-containing protein n=1 Tax=Pedobacter fastidiosus TaxID=2765361 RepID=A0ABR7KXC7_9SPHI|nr:BatA domain-containing protein [Pedobacter fastidiosus]MBC6112766.1 BatA domain-containing protein [Pedobacter fastidiosus]